MLILYLLIQWSLGLILKVWKLNDLCMILARALTMKFCSQANATARHFRNVNIGSGNYWWPRATSHYLSRCWLRFRSSHDNTRSWWVEYAMYVRCHRHICIWFGQSLSLLAVRKGGMKSKSSAYYRLPRLDWAPRWCLVYDTIKPTIKQTKWIIF